MKNKEKLKKSINLNLENQVDEIIKISEYTYQRKLSDELFDKIYGRLIQWEIFDDKQTSNAMNALNKMFTLNLLLFTETKVPLKLAKILKSSNCPENIRACVLKIFNSVIKNKTMKKYLLNKQIVESLVSFIFDYKQVADNLSDFQKQWISDWWECLCLLSYQERLKIYIPGDNIYNMKKRMTASEFGIVLCLLQFEDDFKSLPDITAMIKSIIESFEISDVEAQIKIVKHLKANQNAKHSKILIKLCRCNQRERRRRRWKWRNWWVNDYWVPKRSTKYNSSFKEFYSTFNYS